MTLPKWLRRRLLRLLQKYNSDKRPADFVIGQPFDPYLKRWFIIPRNRLFNLYLHHFLRSDDDRALHDHPWPSVSVLLDGGYFEHLPSGIEWRHEGYVGCRPAHGAHRVELDVDHADRELPVWTLFITGPKVREWGFHCPKGWKHWKEFCMPTDSGQVGKGCE